MLVLLKPLYGLPESPLHWFETYSRHHKDALAMKSLAGDPGVFCTSDGLFNYYSNQPSRLVGLKVDDSFIFENDSFMKMEEKAAVKFPNKGANAIDTKG